MPAIRKILVTELILLKFPYESMNWVLVAIQFLWKLAKITSEKLARNFKMENL